MNNKTIMFGLLCVLAIMLAGCVQTVTIEKTTEVSDSGLELGTYKEPVVELEKEVEMQTFASEEEVEDFFRDNQQSYSGLWGRGDIMPVMMESVAVADGAPVKRLSKSVDLDYSTTNVQVADVDEADIIKTDGDYIYTISNNVLYILSAYPAEDAEVLSTVKLDDQYNPESLFIKDDKLVIFGNTWDSDVFEKLSIPTNSNIMFVKFYDITNRADPKETKNMAFEGSYREGRMYDDTIYLITTNYDNTRPIPIFYDGMAKSMPIDRIYYFDIPYSNPQMTNIYSIDVTNEEESGSLSVVTEYNQNVYMSGSNIYLTYTESVNEYEIEQDIEQQLLKPYLSEEDKKLIEKIKKTDNDVLSQAEKESKISEIYNMVKYTLSEEELEDLEDQVEEKLLKKVEAIDYFEYTIVNRIDTDDLEVSASGKVPGHILNQFSMDEYDEAFRIATTISPRWSYITGNSESSNNIYTLDMDMEILDSEEDIAEGERIYSTRFIGERLYMVTFRQVDPFFVYDLSNPREIKNLGELKIPGFSRYLHPYDEDVIIGIGQEASALGRTEGLKISLFDVSDPANPTELAKFVTEEKYSSSIAEYEHKAFLFSKEKDLLVIPAYSYDYRGGDGYSGAFVFKITKEDIELRGLIDHSSFTKNGYYGSQVERSLYIEDMLYTKSPNVVRINDLDDLHSVNNVTLGTVSGYKVY